MPLTYTIEPLTFPSAGVRLAADLYLPAAPGPHPAVVTAPGFAGVKEMLIPAYGEALASAGVACLAFDYAGFGASEGERRQHVAPREQAAAFIDALDRVAAHPRVDAERLGTWGTSMSGAHAIVAATRDPRVRAVVSIIPFMGAPRRPEPQIVRAVAGDLAGQLVRRPPREIAVAGDPGERAVMTTDGALAWVQTMAAEAPRYENRVTVSSLLEVARYSAAQAASEVEAPTRVILAEDDGITPAAKVRRAVAGNANVELIGFPETHFELFDEHGDEVIGLTVEWLAAHLAPGPDADA